MAQNATIISTKLDSCLCVLSVNLSWHRQKPVKVTCWVCFHRSKDLERNVWTTFSVQKYFCCYNSSLWNKTQLKISHSINVNTFITRVVHLSRNWQITEWVIRYVRPRKHLFRPLGLGDPTKRRRRRRLWWGFPEKWNWGRSSATWVSPGIIHISND